MKEIKLCSLATLAVIILLSMFCLTSVYADDTSLGMTPEGVFPIQESDVKMVSEEINVDLEKNSVECIFVFHNTGKSKNVLMGFPGKLDHDLDDGLTEEANITLRNFKTFVNGKELPVTRKKTIPQDSIESSDSLKYSEYFTFNIPFKEDEEITVHNFYDFTPTYDSMGNVYTGYVLKTGAMWKGLIDSARVTFKLGNIKPYQVTRLKPGGFRFEKNTLVWERQNFEPDYDLNLVYNNYYFRDDIMEMASAEINEKIDTYKNVNKLADSGEKEQLLNLYNKAVSEKDSILALYIKSYLPTDSITDEITTLGDIKVKDENRYYGISCDVIGLEDAFVHLKVSHIENNKEVQDILVDGSTCSVEMTPGIEYVITCTLTDWTGWTVKKSLNYKVPEEAAVSAESPIASTNSITTNLESKAENKPEIKPEITPQNKPDNNLAVAESNEPINKPANDKVYNSKYTKPITYFLSGFITAGLIFAIVVIVYKKRSKKVKNN